ncbi:MAG: transketolase [Thermoproteota archaeon]|nr:transketolase [Thermoproteota archaeon]
MAKKLDDKLIKRLEAIANECRRINATGNYGHGGGTASMQDIAVALYFYKMKHDPKNPDWPERDRLVLGKSHAAGALYAPLALAGYFDKEKLVPLYGGNKILADGWMTPFQMHAEKWATPGIDYTGGSLGQGLGFACGLAYGAILKAPKPLINLYGNPRPDPGYKVYCIIGDGELSEGWNWESAMFAAKYKLSNLVGILDYNRYNMSEDMSSYMEPIVEKWKAFGWWTTEIDGHNMRDICSALDLADNVSGAPKMIIAHTIKGKGVPDWEAVRNHSGNAPKEPIDTVIPPIPIPPED